MGTLTANQERLPGYCDHKLPTSCRLTSIPECCACADERAHSAAYSTYIDGIGFVQRGTRWQRYCWFCKTFWENRVAASGLRPGQTRIPELPDQTDFLERWYEFHRGYRIVRKEDGGEERVPVVGEPLNEVCPGFLPLTEEELRIQSEEGRTVQDIQVHEQAVERVESEAGPTLEDTLEQMYQEASVEADQQSQIRPGSTQELPQMLARSGVGRATSNSEATVRTSPLLRAQPEDSQATSNIHAQAIAPTGTRNHAYQARRVAALRRELHRMRNGIERVLAGLRELGENVPDTTEATGRLADLGRTLDSISDVPSRGAAERAIGSVNALAQSVPSSRPDHAMSNIQARVEEARSYAIEARRARDQAASELDLTEQELRTSQQRLQQAQRERRTTENYVRLFGTREEVIAQGEDYESPIGSMFTRAMERFLVAEEVRREERTLRQVLAHEGQLGGERAARRLAELEARQRDVWSVPRSQQRVEAVEVLETLDETLPRPDGGSIMIQARRHPRTAPPSTDALEAPNVENAATQQSDQTVQNAIEHHGESSRFEWTTTNVDEPGPAEGTGTVLGQHGSIAGQAISEPAALETHNNDEPPAQSSDSPRHRLEEYVIALEREDESPTADLSESVDIAEENHHHQVTSEAPREQQLSQILDCYSSNSERTDAEHVLWQLSQNAIMRENTNWNLEAVHRVIYGWHHNNVSVWDRQRLHHLLRNETLAWQAGLPSHRASRARLQGRAIDITSNGDAEGTARWDNIEAMAEAFQMSAQLRRRSGLNIPEQMRMLFRLQAGQRQLEDRQVLQQMMHIAETVELARAARRDHARQLDEEASAQRELLESQRREAARQGDHSRQELNGQRQATHAFAVAAGRAAMQVGPTALFQQMAERDEETGAVYRRLRENGFIPNSDSPTARMLRETIYRPLNLDDYATATDDSDSDRDDADARGLDARDSGRPAPKSDEEMALVLDCRICYSQVADIACLPCGHLVMCKWCSDQHSPVMTHDHTRPRRAAGCPVCRKNIRQKVRIFRA